MKNYSKYYNYDEYRDNYNDNYDRQTNYYNNATYDRYEQNDKRYGYYDDYNYQQKQQQTPIYDDYERPQQLIQQDYYPPKYDDYYQRRYYAPPLQFTKVYESVYEPIFESRVPQTIKSVYFDEGMISDMEYLNFPLDGGYKRYEFTGKRTHQKVLQPQADQNNPVSIFLTSLLDQLPLERQIEEIRKKLVSFQDFSIPTIFDAIDTNGSQKLVFQEFYQGLSNFVQNCTQETMYLVFSRFEQANQTITLQQFIKIFMPFTNIQTQAANPNYRQLPNDKTSKMIGDLFNLYIAVENRFEQMRRQMKNIGVDYNYIFTAMDINGTKRIGINQFKQAFNTYAYSNIQHNDAQLLFSRYDKSGDGTVSYMEFKTEMEPKLE